jgi:hypothetical protein
MPREPKRFVVADPATFDGNPYEVADRALAQAAAVADVLTDALESAYPMLRSAEFERQLHSVGECSDEAFENSALAKRFNALHASIGDAKRTLRILRRAASFDPKHPPKE